MNPMTDFTLKSLAAHKVRTAVTVIGVMLSTALLMAVLTTFMSFQHFLYEAEIANAGSWMSEVEMEGGADLGEGLSAAAQDASVTGIATVNDVGFAAIDEGASVYGHYLPLVSVEGDYGPMLRIEATEGRLPEKGDEIMLHREWSTRSGVKIGDEITFDVGRRFYDGEELHTSDGYYLFTETDASQDFRVRQTEESLEDVRTCSYTVVGFYDDPHHALMIGTGYAGVVGPEADQVSTPHSQVFLSFDGMSTADEVSEASARLFPAFESITLHDGLLRYMGIRTSGAIWDTLIGIAVILSLVILFASVSLSFNAFAISIAERTAQFGLLASIGATKRQRRRSVFLEGLVVAIIGIPLGILLGVGGCMATFKLIGENFLDYMMGVDIPFDVSIDATTVICVAAISLISILVALIVPSWRAARSNIVELLKSRSDVGILKRRAVKRAAAAASQLWKSKGILGRIGGMGPTLAYINRKRGASKGRAAAVSFGTAIVLFLTAGSLSTFLLGLVDVADDDRGYDVGLSLGYLCDPAEKPDIAAFGKLFEICDEAVQASAVGWTLEPYALMSIPNDMLGSYFDSWGLSDDGSTYLDATIAFLPDESFDSWARSCGLDPAPYHDAARPKAIAQKTAYGNDGEKYTRSGVFANTGTIEVVTTIDSPDAELKSLALEYTQDESGNMSTRMYGYDGDFEAVYDGFSVGTAAVEVDYLAASMPPVVSPGEVCLIMPYSVAQSLWPATGNVYYTIGYAASVYDAVEIYDRLEGSLADVADGVDAVLQYSSVYNYAAELDAQRLLVHTVTLFCGLFTVILMLIALANLFNTITNGLIVRRREFAVMRSIGMGNKAFRSMIASECVSYTLKGFVVGFLISLAVSYLLYSSISLSVSGMAFTMPWTYLGLSVAMTAAVMALSVAYGLHRCKTDDIVEALRSDG